MIIIHSAIPIFADSSAAIYPTSGQSEPEKECISNALVSSGARDTGSCASPYIKTGGLSWTVKKSRAKKLFSFQF
jgi:hypothetical protein